MAQLAHSSFLRSTGSFTICAALFALGGTSCGSSSVTSEGGGAAGSGQAGSGSTGGSAQAGASGSATGGSAGGAGAGGTTGTAACPADTKAGDNCSAVDSVCLSAATCCLCINFPGAGCGRLWDCAMPERNRSECPALAPTVGSTCATLGIVCQYCGSDGPEFRRCSYTSDRSVPPEWSKSAGLQCQN
jgi:hypothetical protein